MPDERMECECHEIHGDAVCRPKSFIMDQRDGADLSDFFKLFADGTRLSILLALDKEELCVCDLCEVLDMNKSAVSHQLRVLKDAHLVSSRKEGRNVFYSLCDDHVRIIIETAAEHISEKD
jgi:ArsR family transcriptional regulator